MSVWPVAHLPKAWRFCSDQPATSESSNGKSYRFQAGVPPRRVPGGHLGSKEELLAGLSESVMNCFTGEEVGELMTETAERSTESGQEMEPYFAALSFNKAHNPIQNIYLREVRNGRNELVSIAQAAVDDPARGCKLA